VALTFEGVIFIGADPAIGVRNTSANTFVS
jgi:hypothetical protein